jgi:amidohydrolase
MTTSSAVSTEENERNSQIEELKAAALRSVDDRAKELTELALLIHANPELGFEERKAQEWLTARLSAAGFSIENGIGGLQTAFRATWSTDRPGPAIGLLAEYDAFPNLGHACGHNLVGVATLGAGLAVRDACADLPGRVEVIGCPAEEVFGGKVLMAEAGAFNGLQAALAVHPLRRTMTYRPSLARTRLVLKFFGKASHASSAPGLGISALDPLIHTFVVVNSLRQFFKDGSRVHGIISKGGDSPNVVPEYAEGVFLVRSDTMKQVNTMRDQVVACARAQALAAGARIEIEEGPAYAERVPNRVIAELYKANLETLGLEVKPAAPEMGSSDVGNVGLICPVVQAFIQCVPESVSTHSKEFAEVAKSEAGLAMMIQGAKSLAMTLIDLAYRPDSMSAATAEWAVWKARTGADR